MISETTAELQKEIESDMETEEVPEIKTKLAVAINKALGPTCDQQSLKQLDELRQKIKQGDTTTKNINKHIKLASMFKEKLVQRQHHLK